MARVIDLSAESAKEHFLKQTSYLKEELPDYINFGPILQKVSEILKGSHEISFGEKPHNWARVNYELVGNKDGRFDWRPFELIHPALYVALVNLICTEENWKFLQERVKEIDSSVVECCSWPMQALVPEEKDNAEQIRTWWRRVEQKSLEYSLDFSHMIKSDVTNCYGSLYTHSISWALHGYKEAKDGKADKQLGDKIDRLIRAGRYGQTNGIPQGSQLMDLIAELVLGYVDIKITERANLEIDFDFKILRYRDDYLIFANSDSQTERVLKIVADDLRHVGMKLGSAKTSLSTNVIEGSIKREKLAAINLQDLGRTEAKTVQKQLLRIHAFCMQHPHSGQLRRLMADFHKRVSKISEAPDDLAVQVAIVTDIGLLSPSSFPAVAATLSHLVHLAPSLEIKKELWERVCGKMDRVPKNGYLEIWLQRVIQANQSNFEFQSDEAICEAVRGEDITLWENGWVTHAELKKALKPSNAIVSSVADKPEKVDPQEIALFSIQAEQYD